jgi:hypothetical protein
MQVFSFTGEWVSKLLFCAMVGVYTISELCPMSEAKILHFCIGEWKS